ncbi:hypothetical protein M885DRAFT_566676 [Pelagophyceae sp. CCMP2097]|nr:hypothetical protein M885DRAFT_566676 [Pelagophyceae sp. CCMP2097]
MPEQTYGGISQNDVTEAATSAASRARDELIKLKASVLAGSVELAVLGALGCIATLVVAVLSFLNNFLALSPVHALIMVYCFAGALAILALEAVHYPSLASAALRGRLGRARLALIVECKFLSTLLGRAAAYLFLGSLLWADSASWLGGAVGAYCVFVGVTMLFVAKRTSMKLAAMAPPRKGAEFDALWARHDTAGDGLSTAELAALCSELGTTLSLRELEAAVLLLDADSSGKVSKEEFRAWWAGDSETRNILDGVPAV